VGIVGQSGCGKSTILNLLLGFYYPNSGDIYLENVKINDFDLSYLR
jgi:ABC-type bacteriocin/lantibiotic exporter with double-glycine peptidase domain